MIASFAEIFHQSLGWLAKHYLELIATISGLIYLFYSVKGNQLLWVYGFISSFLYVYICFSSGIYADMAINIYYVVISVYGFFHWKFFKSGHSREMPVTRLSLKEFIFVVIITAVIYLFIVFILTNYTNSTIPYLDAFTTSASITATWMLARKILEHWLIWIVVDFISIGLYIYKELNITAFLFTVNTIMAIIGFIHWRKEWRSQEIT